LTTKAASVASRPLALRLPICGPWRAARSPPVRGKTVPNAVRGKLVTQGLRQHSHSHRSPLGAPSRAWAPGRGESRLPPSIRARQRQPRAWGAGFDRHGRARPRAPCPRPPSPPTGRDGGRDVAERQGARALAVELDRLGRPRPAHPERILQYRVLRAEETRPGPFAAGSNSVAAGHDLERPTEARQGPGHDYW